MSALQWHTYNSVIYEAVRKAFLIIFLCELHRYRYYFKKISNIKIYQLIFAVIIVFSASSALAKPEKAYLEKYDECYKADREPLKIFKNAGSVFINIKSFGEANKVLPSAELLAIAQQTILRKILSCAKKTEFSIVDEESNLSANDILLDIGLYGNNPQDSYVLTVILLRPSHVADGINNKTVIALDNNMKIDQIKEKIHRY